MNEGAYVVKYIQVMIRRHHDVTITNCAWVHTLSHSGFLAETHDSCNTSAQYKTV